MGLALIAGLATAAHAQAPAQPAWTTDVAQAQETVVDLGHGVYAISTNLRPLAGNVTVAVGSDGLIVVDTQFASLYDKLKARIAALSALPVKFVINTHHHGDHSGGNAGFGRDGAVIVAQEEAREHLGHPPNNFDGTPVKPMTAIGLPEVTYDQTMAIHIAGQTARIIHIAKPAHTDNDSIVYFPDANVISTGDVFGTLLYPNIDPRVGGSIDGMIAAIDQIDALANDQTRIVPGHGPVSGKAGLAEFRAMLVTARDRIGKLKRQGMSEQQVMDANPLADLNARWLLPGSPFAERFPIIVYQSIK
jgi:glyoxylase-like metal-dependent hydrolase (beta-lactamase superfamily II)